ncbi:MAG: class I SAM-dependent methyltransferase [Candidatus Xenobium sp.]|jgi:SAM-dependent methyltransferase
MCADVDSNSQEPSLLSPKPQPAPPEKSNPGPGSDRNSGHPSRPPKASSPKRVCLGLVLTLLLALAAFQVPQVLRPSPSPAEPPASFRPEASETINSAPAPLDQAVAPSPVFQEALAEEILLEYLEARPEDRKALKSRLLEARNVLDSPNPTGSDRINFQKVLYLTYLTEELGEGTHPKKDLNPYEEVCYGFIFENPRQTAAEFLRLRQQHSSEWELFSQLGGGPTSRFSQEIVLFNAEFLDRMGDLEGKTVLEIGGGLGLLAWQAARRVGPTGKVYLVEIDPSLGTFVEYTKTRPEFRELATRLEFRLALAPENPGVSHVDVVVMHDVHLVCNQNLDWFRQKMLPNLVRSLNPGGRLAIQEGFRPDTDQERILRVLSEAGFGLVTNVQLPYRPGFSMVVERP